MKTTIDKKCNHSPDARNICGKCNEPIFYIDLGGPGSGGFWITEKEWKLHDDEMKTKPVPVKWESKSGGEILDDIRNAINNR